MPDSSELGAILLVVAGVGFVMVATVAFILISRRRLGGNPSGRRRLRYLSRFVGSMGHVIEGERQGVRVEAFHAKVRGGYLPHHGRTMMKANTYVRAFFPSSLGLDLWATTPDGFDGILGRRPQGEDVTFAEPGYHDPFRVTCPPAAGAGAPQGDARPEPVLLGCGAWG